MKFSSKVVSAESIKIVKIRVKFVNADILQVSKLIDSDSFVLRISNSWTTFAEAPIGVHIGTRNINNSLGKIPDKKPAAKQKYMQAPTELAILKLPL